MQQVLIHLLVVIVSSSLAFRMNVPMNRFSTKSSLIVSATQDDQQEEADFAEADDPQMFEMNRRVRLGRSKDQDGKSNIWSIEPAMEVIDEDENGGPQKNLFIGGAVIAAALLSLPLFSAFSQLFPDPSDF